MAYDFLMPPRRLYVHVGLMKTGTSYLQATMNRNRDQLAGQGVDLVPQTKRGQYELMLAVRDRYKPGLDRESVTDALPRFAPLLAEAAGSRAVLSQESLAAAQPAQVRRFLEACGDREVHVVATVRDLARQIPSAWQQNLKSGGTPTYEAFLKELREAEQTGSRRLAWLHLDAPAILATWVAELGPDRAHVVTVPPSGSAPTLLMERFLRVLDADASRLTVEDLPRNTGLGRVQAEVLRRVNHELPDELLDRHIYGDIGKRYLVGEVLRGQSVSKIRVPAAYREWVEETGARQVAAIVEAGYAVEGDLADLRCLDASFADDERPPTEGEVTDAAVAALARVLELRADRTARRGARRRARRPVSLRGRIAHRLRIRR